ncbi:formate dehydrogenase subunit gamma [Phreatobacter sp.]|uniref:formate dehydrogenase subunit gamma n=1 Tax=Phreatobacter sp. TaxID=1966341 RepID=UPI003F6F67A9
MRVSLRSFASLLGLFALALVLLVAPAAHAQQPATVNPTASAAQERQLMEALRAGTPGAGTTLSGRITIPDASAGNLIQPQGQAWRVFHQGTMLWLGAIAILGMTAVLALFYLMRGRIMIEAGRSGATILRFSAVERMIHWLTAGCFIILALSGLNVTFGKFILLPIIGESSFAVLSQWAKFAHNYLAWPFMLGLAFMFVVWVIHNIPTGTDIRWFMQGGGLFSKGVHPPARKFNGGQKMIFWSVIIGGALLSISGVYMLFPAAAGGVLALQFWNIVHGVVSVLLIAIMLAHIYIGSVGMEGAADAMTTGEVDLNWAREHHSLWVEEERGKGMTHPHAAGQPAE